MYDQSDPIFIDPLSLPMVIDPPGICIVSFQNHTMWKCIDPLPLTELSGCPEKLIDPSEPAGPLQLAE